MEKTEIMNETTSKTNPRGYKMSTGPAYENIIKYINSDEKQDSFIQLCGISKSTMQNSKIRIPYSVLPEILHVLNMSVLDMYAGVCENIGPDEQDKGVIDLIDRLSDEQCQKLIELSATLTDPWWRNIQQPNPKVLFRTIVPKRIQVKNRRKVVPGRMSKQMVSTIIHEDYQLPVEELIDCARITDVSLHWLLCLKQDTTIYCAHGWGDMLYDHYKLLPTDLRPFLESTISATVKRGNKNG